MVGLALVITRILQVAEVEALCSDSLDDRRGVRSQAHATKDGCTDLHTILLLDLGAHLLGRVTGYGVGNLMSQHDGQRGLILSDGQDALIHTNQSARHTPCVHLLVLHEVELPFVILEIVLQSGSSQVAGDGIGQILPHPLHHRRIGGIGRQFGSLHKVLILLSGEAEDITVAHHQTLLAPRNGHCVGRSAADEYSCDQSHKNNP